ncbi:ABC transporter permease [Thermococcus paralvinellae]|uniref:ABC-type transport system, permease component n=1 Tax=Thermococcus paralvinellae TaxID=582419 RepID=W0I2N9_9EURY|nr:ABC transporter permease subunit [Thermococcus paralvinellae]AHF80321.1 ABC-type transport system, permease component [Thermococcus paralvinellae]
MNSIFNIALKDMYESMRTKRLVIVFAIFLLAGAGMAYWMKMLMMRATMGIQMESTNIIRGTQLSAVKYFLAVLSILLGADAINREIESGTVKVTLSHPIYRDQFILGKYIGRALTVLFAFLLFAISNVAFLLVLGIPLSSEAFMTFIKPLPFFMLFSFVYLSFGVLLSTLIKKPSTAIIVAVLLPIFLEFIYPTIVSMVIVFKALASGVSPTDVGALQESLKKIYMLLSIVPGYNLDNINNAIFYGITSSEIVARGFTGIMTLQNQTISYFEAIGLAWRYIIVLIVMLLLPFAVAYTKFMKADLR